MEFWNKKSYKLEEVDSSILFDFVNGNKSGEDVAFYLDIARMGVDGIFDSVADDYQPPHKDAHELFYMIYSAYNITYKYIEIPGEQKDNSIKNIFIYYIYRMIYKHFQYLFFLYI